MMLIAYFFNATRVHLLMMGDQQRFNRSLSSSCRDLLLYLNHVRMKYKRMKYEHNVLDDSLASLFSNGKETN